MELTDDRETLAVPSSVRVTRGHQRSPGSPEVRRGHHVVRGGDSGEGRLQPAVGTADDGRS